MEINSRKIKNFDYHLIIEIMNEPRRKPSDFNRYLSMV